MGCIRLTSKVDSLHAPMPHGCVHLCIVFAGYFVAKIWIPQANLGGKQYCKRMVRGSQDVIPRFRPPNLEAIGGMWFKEASLLFMQASREPRS